MKIGAGATACGTLVGCASWWSRTTRPSPSRSSPVWPATGSNRSCVGTGRAALDAAHDVDLVLLDLGLPDLDGAEVCRRLRQSMDVPIIVVSARSEEVDRVLLLETGADDYVVKPFGLRELVARIRAVTRRAGGDDGPPPDLVVGPLVVDLRAHGSVSATEVGAHTQGVRSAGPPGLGPGPGAHPARHPRRGWDPNWYGRPRPWTSTWRRCGASSATPNGSRPYVGSASDSSSPMTAPTRRPSGNVSGPRITHAC